MRTLGLHLRIFDSILNVAHQAHTLKLTTFQCFLLHQQTRQRIHLKPLEIETFKELTKDYITKYVHGAYWINMCGRYPQNAYRMMQRELMMAEKLGFTHYVLHPGAAIGWQEKKDALYSFAQLLQHITQEVDITLLLENTAHGGKTVGSDLDDFKLLRDMLGDNHKIQFCIDTAHAFVYGYDISTQEGLKKFIHLVQDTLSWHNVALLHINDSKETLGSKKDRHLLPGQGYIPKEILRNFVHQPETKNIPLIFEVPHAALEDQLETIAYFKS